MLKLKSNLIALVMFVLVLVVIVAAIGYRGASQRGAVTKLREIGVDVFYQDRREVVESYPFLKDSLSADYYTAVEYVKVRKGWDGDVDELVQSLNQLPTLDRTIFAIEDEALIANVKQKAPNLKLEIEDPDILQAMAR